MITMNPERSQVNTGHSNKCHISHRVVERHFHVTCVILTIYIHDSFDGITNYDRPESRHRKVDLGSPSQVKSFQLQVAAEFKNKSHNFSAIFGIVQHIICDVFHRFCAVSSI